MITVRGTYDGKIIRPLDTETLPNVKGEVPVLITFPDYETGEEEKRQRMKEAAARMLAERDTMEPLDCTVKDLIEDGRYR